MRHFHRINYFYDVGTCFWLLQFRFYANWTGSTPVILVIRIWGSITNKIYIKIDGNGHMQNIPMRIERCVLFSASKWLNATLLATWQINKVNWVKTQFHKIKQWKVVGKNIAVTATDDNQICTVFTSHEHLLTYIT